MRALLRSVTRTIRERALLAAGERVAVGVSGGADSVALTLLLSDLAAMLDVTLSGLIHVHHGLRGAEADRDAAFCVDFAQQVHLPIEIAHVDTRPAARIRKISIEAAARELRYAAFSSAAARLGATSVATAHTLDDQAETVLLRLLRGAGSRGLSAIRPKRGVFVRPLIDCRRAEIRDFLDRREQQYCHDSSNADRTVPRNRVRQDLLPVIERIAPAGIRALGRFAALAADDEAYLNERAIAAASMIVLSNEDGVQLNKDALLALPPALARRIVRWAGEQIGARMLDACHVEAVRALAASNGERAQRDLPGLTAERVGDAVVLRPRRTGVLVLTAGRYERVLDVPGSVDIPEARLSVVATVSISAGSAGSADGERIELASGRGDRATVAAEAIRWPLAVRNRRAGDRFRPLGAPGSRKLQDVLVDRKVPREMRDRLPIVTDAEGHIVWVVGVVVAHDVRVTTPEAKVVTLEARQQEH